MIRLGYNPSNNTLYIIYEEGDCVMRIEQRGEEISIFFNGDLINQLYIEDVHKLTISDFFYNTCAYGMWKKIMYSLLSSFSI
jgi:hypothetical protein